MTDRELKKLSRRELLELLASRPDSAGAEGKAEQGNKAGSGPTAGQLARELKRVSDRERALRMLRNTIAVLIVAAAVSILAATLFLPVLKIYGSSMAPGLEDGNIVVALKGSSCEPGDIISFYYNNEILIKRVIATEGDWVNIDEEGNVYVNDVLLDEPYLKEKALGKCDISLPYQVPDGRVFVMGDHRSASIDSRSREVGCIEKEDIVGKVIFRLWPLSDFGKTD